MASIVFNSQKPRGISSQNGSASLKVALMATAPTDPTQTVWSGISANEASGTGYTEAARRWLPSPSRPWPRTPGPGNGPRRRPSSPARSFVRQRATATSTRAAWLAPAAAAPTWPTTVGTRSPSTGGPTWECVGTCVSTLTATNPSWSGTRSPPSARRSTTRRIRDAHHRLQDFAGGSVSSTTAPSGSRPSRRTKASWRSAEKTGRKERS